jgi:hypothetical protein
MFNSIRKGLQPLVLKERRAGNGRDRSLQCRAASTTGNYNARFTPKVTKDSDGESLWGNTFVLKNRERLSHDLDSSRQCRAGTSFRMTIVLVLIFLLILENIF